MRVVFTSVIVSCHLSFSFHRKHKRKAYDCQVLLLVYVGVFLVHFLFQTFRE